MNNDITKVLGDIVNTCSNGGSYLTMFLSLDELQTIKSLEKDYPITYFGGYEHSERVKAFINKKNARESEFSISVLKIMSSAFLELNHRNILGTIMSLGINRNVLGDIIVKNSRLGYVLVDNEMVDYIKKELTSINNMPVILAKVSYNEINEIEINSGISKDIIVPSHRIDVILTKGFNMSRATITSDINHGLVFINNKSILKCDYKVLENTIISYRGHGRIKVNNVVSKTKSNKIVLNVEIFK